MRITVPRVPSGRTRTVLDLLILRREGAAAPVLPGWARLLWPPLWAVGAGLALSALTVLALAPGSAQFAPASVQLWLVANQTSIATDGGTVSLLPLGLTIVPILLWARAARWTMTRREDSPREFLGGAAAVYVAGALLLALLVRVQGATPSLISAVIGSLLVLAAGTGLAWWRERSEPLRWPSAVVGGAVIAAGAVATGALVLVVLALTGHERIGDTWANVAQGAGESAAVWIVAMAYLPNLILLAAAYATGAGITFGPDVTISPLTDQTAIIPDLPLLGALSESVGGWTVLLPGASVALGALAGAAAQRRSPRFALGARLARAAGLGLLVLVLWSLVRPMAGGSLGDGRLDWVGPAWGTAVLAGALTFVGAAVWALFPTLVSDAGPVLDLRDRVRPSSWRRGAETDSATESYHRHREQ